MKLEELVGDLAKTRLLYFYDSYLREFEAQVLKSVREQGKSWYVVFDQTAFHPKGGGQPTDTGRILYEYGSAQVRKAILESGVVVHYVKLEGDRPPQVGDRVRGFIDWGQRYMYMRRHTAAHLFDHCVNEAAQTSFRTRGSWLGAPTPYVDYGGDPPSSEVLSEAERLANWYIAQNLEVKIEFADKTTVQGFTEAPNIWRLPESEVYRVVRIDGFERIPCGGTHVRATGEVGGFRVLGVERLEGGFRVAFDVVGGSDADRRP